MLFFSKQKQHIRQCNIHFEKKMFLIVFSTSDNEHLEDFHLTDFYLNNNKKLYIFGTIIYEI